MPDKKPTDNEIKKALERLENTKDYLKEQYQEQVKKCPYPELKPIAKQTYEDNKKAFDIAIKAIEEINRQKAEIERLTNKVEELSEVLSDTIRIRYAEAKAEAYKEFAERLKEKLHLNGVVMGSNCAIVEDTDIDNLLKEMVGDN